MLGWMFVAVGFVPFWVAYKALQRGAVSVGDKVKQTRYTREDSPAAFWFGVGFYVLLGVALIVLGGLEAFGVLDELAGK
jgi:hypothetical protein